MHQFNWFEYLVFCGMLFVSALTGVWFGFIKTGGQDTVSGYILGGKEMKIFPVSMSLTASFISGITILGIPAELYTYGTQYCAAVICFVTVCWICYVAFLPVFYRLQSVSVYEYMELRFDRRVRKLVSFLYTASLISYIPVVIYGPALALNQVSGLDIHSISLVVCVICIFYTSFGGLKAVVWADTLQGFVMILASVVVAVLGTIRVGGLTNIYRALHDGQRLEFFNFDPDPTLRSSFWTIVIGQTMSWSAGSSVSPSAIQRFVALNSLSKARKSLITYTFGCFVFFFLSAYMGAVIYTQYQGCDPLVSGAIKRSDQILPYFILDVLGDIPGLPGLFLAGVVCAALSTMSTGLNTVAGTLYEDFIEPAFGKTTEFRASLIMKFTVVVFGAICLSMVFVIEKLGSLVTLSTGLGGLTAGSIFGIFVLGLFFPPANGIGAFVGGVGNLSVMSWIVIGTQRAYTQGRISYPGKPSRIDLCPSFNVTSIPPLLYKEPAAMSDDDVFPLFKLSIFYYTLFGVIVTVSLGLVTSYLTGPNSSVDPRLLTPYIRKFYTQVPTIEQPVEMKNGKIVKNVTIKA